MIVAVVLFVSLLSRLSVDDLDHLRWARRAVRLGLGRELREWAGLSQIEVGAACGVSHAAVCRWERGNRVPHGSGGIAYGALLRRWYLERSAEEEIA
ncbi:MAG: helix-turn-helix domain-containing protein [Gemmatimonadota bacterium]